MALFLVGMSVGPDGNIYVVATEGVGAFSLTPVGVLRWQKPEPFRGLARRKGELHRGIMSQSRISTFLFALASQQIGKITPTGQFIFYTMPETAEQITRGPDSSLLFTTSAAIRWRRSPGMAIVTGSPEIPNSGPTRIVKGPSRQVWFLGYGSNRVYRLTFVP